MSRSSNQDVSELIRKARAGDPACRDALFALCRSYLGVVAGAQIETWLRAKVDASDVVQQTMLEAHRDFARFDGQSEKEWLGWLRGILKHNLADFVRCYRGTAKRQARREVRWRDPAASTFAHGVPEPAAPGATPSQEVVRMDNELRVAAALAELPEDYREVIALRNFQRLPFAEVAERMNRSRPAAQMLWMRALAKLEEALEGEGIEI
ncbi:MAG TPA: sigma-70 family RNA polymerase sigma factor [Thermoguttaceae bacterium]|nr:sigma-70 family RNA polymerase sigma factor [Thermoguttaceae bacterium]